MAEDARGLRAPKETKDRKDRKDRKDAGVLVIGLGRFGSTLASTLETLGRDVLAVEKSLSLSSSAIMLFSPSTFGTARSTVAPAEILPTAR